MTPPTHVVRRGSGRPLLLIHGIPVDHRLLLPLDDSLATGGEWERIYVDLPGFGGTPALSGAGGAPEMADWLRSFVRTTVAVQPFAVLGISFGALLARSLVADVPEQALGVALVCPVVETVHSRRIVPEKAIVIRDEGLLDSLTNDERATPAPPRPGHAHVGRPQGGVSPGTD